MRGRCLSKGRLESGQLQGQTGKRPERMIVCFVFLAFFNCHFLCDCQPLDLMCNTLFLLSVLRHSFVTLNTKIGGRLNCVIVSIFNLNMAHWKLLIQTWKQNCLEMRIFPFHLMFVHFQVVDLPATGHNNHHCIINSSMFICCHCFPGNPTLSVANHKNFRHTNEFFKPPHRCSPKIKDKKIIFSPISVSLC